MRRLFRLLPITMLLLAAFPAFAQLAAVTGTVTDAGGVGVPNAYLQFDLYGCGGNRPRWTGGVVSSSVQLYGDANGAVTGNVVRNDQITCANTVGNTTYFVQQFINGQPSGPRLQYQINAGTFNWNTQVAITQAPVVAAPTGDTVYARLDGGNMPFTGTVTHGGHDDTGIGTLGAVTGNFSGTLGAVTGNFSGNELVGGTLGVTGAFTAGSFTNNLSLFAATTSAQLAAVLTDESGTGVFCMTVSCVMTTPNIGAATATSVTTGQIIQPAATALTIKDNQGGTRLSIPAGGVAQGQINNTSLTGASTSNTVNLFTSGCTPQGPTASINGTGAPADIFTCSLPANTVENGKLLHVICSGVHDTGTVSTSIAINLNGQQVDAAVTGTAASQSFSLETYILRTSTTTAQTWGLGMNTTGTTQPFSVAATGLAWTSNQTLNCQFSVAAGDHITGRVWAPMSDQ